MTATSHIPRLLLVVPCYNEAERLPHFLPLLAETLEGVDCLIQVVDDGSQQVQLAATGALVEELRTRFPTRLGPLLPLPANLGKGAAIRAGWRAHPGSELLAFVDADGAVSPREVHRVVHLAMAAPEKAYFASRVKMLGRNVNRSLLRHFVGRVYATAVSLRLNIAVYDSQCGLKIVPRALFAGRDSLFEENGFAFDLELLAALLDQGFLIQEVPVDWTHVSGSKIHLIRDSIRLYLSLNRVARHRAKWTSPNKIK